MNFKVKTPTFWEDYQYFVNEEKRTVVAKKENFCSDFYKKLDNLCYGPMTPDRYLMEFIARSWVEFCNKRNCFSITAKATCSEEDDFSILIGEEIARLRLEEKTQRIYTDFFVYVEEQFAKVLFGLCQPVGDKAFKKGKFLNEKLMELFADLDEAVKEGE